MGLPHHHRKASHQGWNIHYLADKLHVDLPGKALNHSTTALVHEFYLDLHRNALTVGPK